MAVDIFASTELFRKNFEGLVHSYVTEAILNGSPVNISEAAVDSYMNELLDEKKQDKILKTKGGKLEAGNKKLRISSFE